MNEIVCATPFSKWMNGPPKNVFVLICEFNLVKLIHNIFRRKAQQNNPGKFHFVFFPSSSFFFFSPRLEILYNQIKFNKWDKHFVLRYFFFYLVCVGCCIHSFLSEKQKGHRCIIVSAPVKMPSEVVRIPDAQYKSRSCFFSTLKNDAAAQRCNPHMWTSPALCNTYWSCLLSQCAEVKLGHWLTGSWLCSKGATGSGAGRWVRAH